MRLSLPQLNTVVHYSNLMALGTLTMLLGMGYSLAFEALVLFILVHSLYKGALFMVAGTLDHETGTRDYRRLGGLGNYIDRKSTRLNSSHVAISYAVFCLYKKNIT